MSYIGLQYHRYLHEMHLPEFPVKPYSQNDALPRVWPKEADEATVAEEVAAATREAAELRYQVRNAMLKGF